MSPAEGWKLGAALAMALVGVALGCGSPAERAASHLERAAAYQAKGEIRAALIELRNALAADPSSAEAAFRLGRLLEQAGEEEDARFFYAEAAALEPARTDARLAEIRLTLARDPDGAAQKLDALLAADPDLAEAHHLRARLALVRGDVPAALEAAERALALATGPARGDVLVERARIRRSQIEGARRTGTGFEASLAEAAWRDLEEAQSLGAERWRLAFEQASWLATWPGREAEAEGYFREAVRAAAKQAPHASRRQVFLHALRYARRGDGPELARWVLESWIERDPSELVAWKELARLEERSGGDAEAVYRRLLAARPDDADAHRLFVRSLVAGGRVEEAIAHLKEAAPQVERGRPALLGELVRLELGVGDLQGARGTVEALASRFPEEPETALAHARLAQREGRLGEAAEALRRHPELQRRAAAQRLLGEVELARHQPALALPALDHALQLSGGNDVRAWILKARAHALLGQWGDALRSYGVLGPRADRLPAQDRLQLARAYFAMGSADRGRQLLEAVLEDPQAPTDAALELARRERDRDPDGARRALEKALERDPTRLELHAALARLDLREGATARALARLDTALPAVGEGGTLLRVLRGEALTAAGRTEEAEREVRRVLDATPDDPAALGVLAERASRRGGEEALIASLRGDSERRPLPETLLLARLLGARGDREGARELLEEVVQQNPDRVLPGAWSALAVLLVDEEAEIERALALAQRAAATHPDDPEVLDRAGRVYLRSELPGLALEAFERAATQAAWSGAPDARIELHRGLALEALGRSAEARLAFGQALTLAPDLGEARAALGRLDAAPRAPAANPPS